MGLPRMPAAMAGRVDDGRPTVESDAVANLMLLHRSCRRRRSGRRGPPGPGGHDRGERDIGAARVHPVTRVRLEALGADPHNGPTPFLLSSERMSKEHHYTT